MRFDYENKQDDRECVAYIDEEGDLVINNRNHYNHGGAVYLTKEGRTGEHGRGFNPSEAIHKFYPGDSITLSFE